MGSTQLAFRRVFSFQLSADSDSKVRYLCVINHSGDFQDIQLYQELVVDTPNNSIASNRNASQERYVEGFESDFENTMSQRRYHIWRL